MSRREEICLGEAQALLDEREAARPGKDFARADEIRDRLAELGWEVRDSADGAKLVPEDAPDRRISASSVARVRSTPRSLRP